MKTPLALSPRLIDLLRNPFVRLRMALLVGALLGVVGMTGYVVIEHYSPLDALYMTVITLATVGYTEVHPLNAAGKIFTICLILGGIGTAAWVFTTVIEVFVSEQTFRLLARRRMDRVVGAMRDHYIVCGYGRIGQQIAVNYKQNRVAFVVIEQDAARIEMLREADVPHIEGDAADDEILKEAGIDRAAALIAVTPTDAVNTFIVLSARELRPDLFIVARSDTLETAPKLYRAGATRVVSTHALGGRWMGITAVNPAVTDFVAAMTDLDHANFLMREFVISPDSAMADAAFGEADIKTRTGALVVAVREGKSQTFLPNPPDDYRVCAGDIFIAIGSPKQLTALARLTDPTTPPVIYPRGMRPA